MQVVLDALIVAAIFYFFVPAPAHAYFDLGMGTYMIQIMFGFAVAWWFAAKRSLRTYLKPKTDDTSKEKGNLDESSPKDSEL